MFYLLVGEDGDKLSIIGYLIAKEEELISTLRKGLNFSNKENFNKEEYIKYVKGLNQEERQKELKNIATDFSKEEIELKTWKQNILLETNKTFLMSFG